jgi:hypothetical protein
VKKLLFIIPLLLISLACFPGSTSTTTAPTSAGSAPVIVSFTATPSNITPKQNSTLSWNVTGATSIIIDNGVGTVDATGSRVVSPNTSTNYTLIATNAIGAVSQPAAIIVGGVPPPPWQKPNLPNPPNPPGPPIGLRPNIVLFDINPNIIRKSLGEKATIRWDVQGAVNVRIEPGFGDVPHSGNRVLTPPNDTVYTITANNPNGTVSSTQNLVVRP